MIATNRSFAGKFTAPFKYDAFQVRHGITFNLITLSILALVTLWNFTSFANSYIFHHSPTKTSQIVKRVTHSKTAQSIRWLGELTRLDQSWSIFAPNPPRDDGWHVIVGKLKNGKEVNLLEEDSAITWDKPTIKQRDRLYQNMQWRTYFINLNRNIGKQLYPHYGNYLCQQWNSKHQSVEKLESLEVYFMSERTVPPEEQQTVTKESHWQQSCN